MTIEKNREGAWVIYASGADGYLVTRSYYGYTKRDAVRLFREHMRGESKWAPAKYAWTILMMKIWLKIYKVLDIAYGIVVAYVLSAVPMDTIAGRVKSELLRRRSLD